MSIGLSQLSKAYGGTAVLDGLDLAIDAQSFTVLCGPPGCGKTVLLRLLVGLESPDAGTMTLGGVDITHTGVTRRALGYVPQSFALYPHLSVRANIGYSMKLARRRAPEIARRVEWAAGVLAITHLLDKTPDQLSGGEKQRTALARGLLKEADIFLLDDPLVGLDYKLRERLMDELKTIRRELGATFVYATSDSLEALTMAEKLVVIDGGRVIQHGDVMDVYRRPVHHRSMELIGFPRANMLPVTRRDGTAWAGPFALAGVPDDAMRAGVRPEALILSDPGMAGVTAHVTLIENLGGEEVVYVEAAGHALTLAVATGGRHVAREGEKVGLALAPGACVLFEGASGARLEATPVARAAGAGGVA